MAEELSEREEEFLKRWWNAYKPERMTWIEVVNLYKKIKKLAEEMGIPDPETWVQNNWDLVDSTLTYSENLARLEAEVYTYGREEYLPKEMEELEYWKERAEKLEEQLKTAFTLEEKRELEKKIKELRRKLEEKEKEIAKLSERVLPEHVVERISEFEKTIREASTEELISSLELLEKERPPEMSEEEWVSRINAIKRELERRGVPKSKTTGKFLIPVAEWKGIPVPPEMRLWYDPYEKRYYRDGKPVTPEYIDRAIRQLLKPIEVVPAVPAAPPLPPEEEIIPAKLYRLRFEKLPSHVREHYLVKMLENYAKIGAIELFSKYNLSELTEDEYKKVLDYAIDMFISKAPTDIDDLVALLEEYL